MPPAVVRRPLTISAWLAMSVLYLALSPLLLALAALVGALTRRPQPLILVRLLVVYFAHEAAVLIACGVLWLASGGGILMGSRPLQFLHYRLLRWFVRGVAGGALAILQIDVPAGERNAATQALDAERSALFFSRHAGPGDTVLLLDLLLTRFNRLPSVVFKQSLLIDPSVDLIAHRLPHAVLDLGDPEECEARIEKVAAELGDRGVLMLFPEGGNFSEERRERAIRNLWHKDRRREAAKAQRMSNVLPPRPTGALAALRGNPTADVVFAAHTGLGRAAFPTDLWRQPPIARTLITQMWLVPAAERPTDPEQQVSWLYDWWQRLDGWIEQQAREAGGEDGDRGR
jgi:1-acyl-sn-glycerol-3-phosphate acyltransferase